MFAQSWFFFFFLSVAILPRCFFSISSKVFSNLIINISLSPHLYMDILAPCWYFRFLGLIKFQYSAYVIFCAGHPWIVDDSISLDKPLDSAILSHLKQFSETNKLKKMDLHVRFLQICSSFLWLYYWFLWKNYGIYMN